MTIITNPYNPEGKLWLKGNLHCHSDRSDGDLDAQEVINTYADLGYDFLMLSDHDVLADYTGLNPRGMVLIPGNEVSAFGPHIHQVGGSKAVYPHRDRQEVIDQVNKEGFAICNHPEWDIGFRHIPWIDLLKWKGYAGIEIYNHIAMWHGMALNTWDVLLSNGRKVWGYGADDSHRPEGCGKAWNMVLVREKTLTAVVEALRMGSFYVSTGVSFREIITEGDLIRVKAEKAQKIIISGEHGARIKEASGNELEYRLGKSDVGYIRITALGGADEYAWSQPLFVEGPPVLNIPGAIDSAEVPVVEKGPELTGRLDDPLWQKGALIENFANYDAMEKAEFSPRVRLVADRDYFYAGVECPEPELDKVKNMFGTGKGSIWADDNMEFFIDASGKRKNYYQFVVNAYGHYQTIEWGCDPFPADLKFKAGKSEKSWIIEMAVPLSALGKGNVLDSSWAFNMARNKITKPKEASIWRWTGRSYHTPHRFGELKFKFQD
jgi:hypothetical protein